jgi:uncharacterized protein YcbX
MLMTEESLTFLNEKLQKPVTHKNFRPSIIVEGVPEVFSEDDWGYIRFNNKETGSILKASLPCSRFVYPIQTHEYNCISSIIISSNQCAKYLAKVVMVSM